MTPYRSVLIVGGGTAGWLAAAWLQRRLAGDKSGPVAIRLVESPDIGTIGVGESTIPTLRQTLRLLDIPETRLFDDADATLKNGIRFIGWRHGAHAASDRFDHPFDPPLQLDGHSTMVHWLNLHQQGMEDRLYCDRGSVQSALFDPCLSPKPVGARPYEAPVPYGYHVDAGRLAAVLRETAIARGVQHTRAGVTQVQTDDTGIRGLTLADGRHLQADLYVDCTGFAALLIGALQVPWVSFADHLLCDRALACPVRHARDEPRRRSYTTAHAQGAGWIWDIDLQSRRGTGYVYASAHCSDDQAAATLQRFHGAAERLAEPRPIGMRVGHRARPWEKNCLALGLAAGFIEPLESTGIYLIEHALAQFVACLPDGRQSPAGRARYQAVMTDAFEELRDFIVMHYHLSMRRDTPFWRDCTDPARLPPSLVALLALWRRKIPDNADLQRAMPVFGAQSYFHILSGLGRLPASNALRANGIDPSSSRRALEQVAQARQRAAAQAPPMHAYLHAVRGARR